MNKNTKRLMALANKARNRGEGVVSYKKPVGNYHSALRGQEYTQGNYPVYSGAGEVSVSRNKNLKMVVAHNVDAKGKKHSGTIFEPLVKGAPVYRRKWKEKE